MALKLKEIVNGIECDYWKLITVNQNTIANNTTAILGLYLNKDQRDSWSSGFLKREVFTLDGLDMTRAEIYAKITESKPLLITPAVEAVAGVPEVPEIPAVFDEEGNEITPAVPMIPAIPAIEAAEAVYEETNKWALAEAV